MRKLKMYIPIRDETLHMIKVYQYLFNKYWKSGLQVYFLGYQAPNFNLDRNIHFISMAESRENNEHSWSTKIVDFFSSIDDDFFYFSLEDFLVIRPVDNSLLEICEEVLEQNVGRIDLWNSVQFDPNRKPYLSFYKEHKGVTFVKESQDAGPECFRVSCSSSIWNRKWFLKTLQKNWSPIDWEELANDGRNSNDGYDVISPIDRWTPTVVHAFSSNWSPFFNIDGMLPEDFNIVRELYDGNKQTFFRFTKYNQVLNLEGYQPSKNDKSNY